MAEKTLNTRILLKYDTLTAWQSSTTILKAGEVAIAVVGSSAIQNDNGLKGDASSGKTPIVGIKVGDGSKTFSQLNWIQAIAGDVPSWAKESDWATVKAAYEAAISTAISDLSSTGDLKKLADRVNTNETAIETLEDNVETLLDGGTTNVGKVELITAITMKNGKVESYTTQKIKVGDIFLADGTTTLEAKLTNIDTELGKKAVAATVTADIAAAKTDILGKNEAGTADFDGTVAGAYAAAAEAKTAAENAEDNAIAHADGLINGLNKSDSAVADQFVTAVSETKGVITVSREAVTSVLGIADSYNKSTNKIATVATVDNKIAGLDSSIAETADSYIASITQTDGKITGTKKSVSDALGFAGTAAYNKTSNPIATKKYVDDAIDDLNDSITNLTGALRFRGTVTTDPNSSTTPPDTSDGMGDFQKGDVLLNTANSKEFIYDGSNWVEIGSEGVYAIKSEVNGEISGIKGRLTEAEGDISTLSGDHNTLKGRVDTIEGAYASKTYVDSEVKKVSDELTKTDGINDRLDNVEDAIGTITTETIPNAINTAKDYTNTEISKLSANAVEGTGSFVKGVAQSNGKITVTKGSIALSDIAGLIKVVDVEETTGSNIASGDILTSKGYVDKAIENAIDAENIGTQITNAINALDSSVAATAEANNQVSVLTGVTQTDGKLTAKTEVKLAAIAKTGNVNDLIQTTSDVLILDCGNASRDNE